VQGAGLFVERIAILFDFLPSFFVSAVVVNWALTVKVFETSLFDVVVSGVVGSTLSILNLTV
jgi:hypothetical protein